MIFSAFIKHFKPHLPVVFLVFMLPVFNGFSQHGLEGVWKSEDEKYILKIASIGDEYQGRIVWLQREKDEKGNPLLDSKNPDEKLQKLPVKGGKILKELRYNPSNKQWEGGTVYLPDTGKTFNCTAEVKGNRLMIRYSNEKGESKSWNWIKSS